MFATREQIEQYALENDLQWRNDSSNSSLKYLRNKIRHKLLPEIQKITGDFNTIFQSLDNLKEDALVLDTLLKNERSKHIKTQNGFLLINPDKTPKGLPESLWFYYLLKEYGFTRYDTDKIFDAYQKKSTGKHFFSEQFELLINRGNLLIRKRKATAAARFLISAENTFISEPFKSRIRVMSGNTINPTLFKNPGYGFFDMDKLSFPLILRKWRKGDRFKPYGLKGSKLVSDFFTDIKLSQFEKEKVWILESDGVIAWVVGYRTAEPFKVTKNTKTVFSVQLSD